MSTSFHKSNFGRFGENLPCDLDGYVHTTAEGWRNAPLDALGDEQDHEEMAERAREAVAAAEKALGEWQKDNA